MSDSFRRQSTWLVMIPAFGLAACVVFQGDGDGEGGTDDLTPETSLPIAAGRSFAVLSSLNQDREVLKRRVYPSLAPDAPAELPEPGEADLAGDPDWVGISRFVARWCQEPLEERLDRLGDGPAASTLRQGQHYLCMGHSYLNMAVSPLPTVIEAPDFDHIKYVDQPSDALNLAHITIRQPASTDPPSPDAGPPIYEIPPQSASDAATLALVASEYFRGALFMHAMVLRYCADNPCILGDQVPAGRRDGEDTDYGLSEDETVAAASVVITGMIESWRATREASDETERLLLAASQARLSDNSGDNRQARILSWRGLTDSRLEQANRLVGVAPRMFEPAPDVIVHLFDASGAYVGDGPVPAFGDYPVVDLAPTSEAERRAEGMLRSTRVDPRTPDLAAEVLDALREDYPGAFETDLSAEAFFSDFGITGEDFRSAAYRLVQEAEVFGRVIVPEHLVTGDTAPSGVVRVTGTTMTPDPDPAYLYALTAGSVRMNADLFHDYESLFDLAYPEPLLDYAYRGIYGAADFASAALGRYLASDQYQGLTLSDVEVHTLEQAALAFKTEVHGLVPMRVDIGLEGGLDSGDRRTIERLLVVVYGVGEEIAGGHSGVYELWWGQEGLECATTGQVGLVPCNPDDYRLETAGDWLSHDGGAAGHGDDVVTLWVDPAIPPPVFLREAGGGEVAAGLPAGERIYLTKRPTSGGRIALMGLDTTPYGPRPGQPDRWVRWNQYPVGRPILDELHRILGPSSEDPTEPATTCAGVPWDIRLPLEDELTEASEGSDQIESSFAHSLFQARQAAEHADQLGQELLQYGLEMDLRAEAARNDLEDICGEVVNAPDFTFGDGANCEEDDPSTCGHGQQCFLGRCITGEPQDLLPASTDDPAAASLLRCLGDLGGDLVAATLGDEPHCYYYPLYGDPAASQQDRPHGLPCQCEGEDCPPCPVPAEYCVGDPFEADHVFEALDSGDWWIGFTVPLNVVEPESGGDGPADCMALARFRQLLLTEDAPSRSDLYQAVRDQSWINQETFAALAGGLTFELSPGWYTAVRRGGNAWFSTGSPDSGPATDCVVREVEGQPDGTFELAWPCVPATAEIGAALGCAEGGSSILCGVGDCEASCPSDEFGTVGDFETCAGRPATYARLALAVNTLRTLSGLPRIFNRVGAVGRGSSRFDDLWALDGVRPLDPGIWVPEGTLERYSFIHTGESTCRRSGDILDEPLFGTMSWYAAVLNSGMVYFKRPGLTARGETYRGCAPVTSGARGTCLSDSPDMPVADCPNVILRGATETDSPQLDTASVLRLWRPDFMQGSVSGLLRRHGQQEDPLASEWPDGSPVNEQSLWDALELVCMHAAEGAGGGCASDPSTLPTIRSGADFPRLERALRCSADSLERQAAGLLFVNLPISVAEDIQRHSISPTFPSNRGTRGETVAELRGAMVDIGSAVSLIGTALLQFGSALRTARSSLRIADLESKTAEFERLSSISSHISACVAAASPSMSVGTSVSVSFNPGAAAATCSDAAVQTDVANAIEGLRQSAIDEGREETLNQVAYQFSSSMEMLAQAGRNLEVAYANTNRLLARLDSQSRAASRALSGVMLLGEDGVGREYAVNRVMRARYDTTLARYQNAHQNAVRMAFLARRAIEQRLGVDMSDLTADMLLVEAPSTWADRVCTMSGIDYGAIREGAVTSYSDGFVGDYVRDLELFLESYRFDYPFQDGQDIAVLSLKNDLLGARAPCDVEGYNELLWTVDLAAPDIGDGVGWMAECSDTGRCPLIDSYDGAPFTRHSLDELVFGLTEDPIGGRPLGEAPGFRMTIGCERDDLVGGVCETPLGEGAGLSQPFWDRSPGLYLVSWYERLRNAYLPDGENCFGSSTTLAPDDVPLLRAVVTFEDGSTEVLAPSEYIHMNEEHLDGCLWRRAFAPFVLDTTESFTVRFEIDPAHLPPGATEAEVVWGAPQLEHVSGVNSIDPSVLPRPFFPTDDDYSSGVGLCEDVTGESLRNDHWSYGCEYVCPDGFGGTCGSDAPDRSLLRCYYETSFDLSLLEIEQGHMIPTGALALGNFNYRTDSFALNLVGANLRNCELAELPSSCYSSGSIPYSLRHSPPYRVRNYFGDIYESRLHVGNIEQARALTAERYLSNPLSSTDRGLIEPYLREELRGRPLEGLYRLRIFDIDGLDWAQLEDVQILLNYRYWTRFGD